MDVDTEALPIHPKQNGFTKGKSTESAISDTADYIERYLYQGQHCLGLFLDISAAFDSISIDHIKQCLLDHGGDPEVVGWYHSYLGRRYLEVELHGERVNLTTATGFPQGGVCSARFWLLAFNQAIRIINSEGIVGNGYADNCGALIGGSHPHNMIEKMQSMLDRLVAWGNTCGLRFNPQKTVAVMFTRATRPFNRLVRMDGALILYSDSVVYLGVTLDKELKWQHHIDNKIKKAKSLLMKMASITYSYWGPKPKLMRWMFTGIVRPMISYAAMVWAHQIEHDTLLSRLESLNRAAMNTIVKVPRSTPTKGLQIILDIMPLHLHIHKEGLAAFLRIKKDTPIQWEGVFLNRTNSVSHLKYWELFLQDTGLPAFNLHIDECYVLRPPAQYVMESNSFVDMNNYQEHVECNVYTDGSKMNGRVGAGIHILQTGRDTIDTCFRLPNYSTVYQAEVAAIREAALILQPMTHLTNVKFFVDSQAALQSFLSDFITSELLHQAIMAVNLIPATSVTLVWTKAHIGTAGNERADQLAKQGTTNTTILTIPTPRSHAKAYLKHLFLALWTKEWETCPEGRQTKLYHPSQNTTKANKLIQWARLKLGRYIRAVTGHNNLLYHLSNMDPNISPICRFCLQANEEFFHLATDCPPLWWERHLISATEPDHATDWSIDQIIKFAYLPAINTAFVTPLYQPSTLSIPSGTQNKHDDDDLPLNSSMIQDSDSEESIMNITTEDDSTTSSISITDHDDDDY